MRPVSVYANLACPAGCPCDVLGALHGPHRVGLRLVMILLSARGQSARPSPSCWAAMRARCVAGSTATTPRVWPDYATSPALAGHAVAALGLPSASCACWPSHERGRSPGSTSGWAAPRSALPPCAAGCARWPGGGGPGWWHAATPTARRPWPHSVRASPSCLRGRSCWPRMSPTCTCCPGCAPPGSPTGSPRRS
jgi:hypothetical protein